MQCYQNMTLKELTRSHTRQGGVKERPTEADVIINGNWYWNRRLRKAR